MVTLNMLTTFSDKAAWFNVVLSSSSLQQNLLLRHDTWRSVFRGFQLVQLLILGACCRVWCYKIWLSIWLFTTARILAVHYAPPATSKVSGDDIALLKNECGSNNAKGDITINSPSAVGLMYALFIPQIISSSAIII